jgi:hypothetical protein
MINIQALGPAARRNGEGVGSFSFGLFSLSSIEILYGWGQTALATEHAAFSDVLQSLLF